MYFRLMVLAGIVLLSAGAHVLKPAPQESIYVNLIAVTNNPGMFG